MILDSPLTKNPHFATRNSLFKWPANSEKITINSLFHLQHSKESVKNVASTTRIYNKGMEYIKLK